MNKEDFTNEFSNLDPILKGRDERTPRLGKMPGEARLERAYEQAIEGKRLLRASRLLRQYENRKHRQKIRALAGLVPRGWRSPSQNPAKAREAAGIMRGVFDAANRVASRVSRRKLDAHFSKMSMFYSKYANM